MSNWFEPLRFIKHYRERQAEQENNQFLERQADRAHQQALLQSFLHSLESLQDSTVAQRTEDSRALIAVAKGLAAQAEAFNSWLTSFQTTQTPSTSTVREEDEYALEQLELVKKGFPADIAALPEEWRMAYALRNDPMLAGLNDTP